MSSEKTPLASSLVSAPADYTSGERDQPAAVEHGPLQRALGVPSDMNVKAMTWELTSNFVPAAGTTLLFYATQTITMMFVGRQLGTQVLAQYGVGQSILSVVGVSLAGGMAVGIDTLCAQSYGRHKSGPEFGEILQRGTFICLALSLPVVLLFFAAEPIVTAALGDELGGGVGVYLRWAAPLLVFIILFTCLQKGLQAQQLPHLPLIGAAVSVVLCPFLNMWLTHHGIEYAVIVLIICNAVSLAVTWVASLLHKGVIIYDAKWPSKQIFDWTEIKAFLAIGVPSMVSAASEWWAFEVLVIVCAIIGQREVAAYEIAFNVLLIVFAVPTGVAVAVGVLVGSCVGENNGAGARAYVRLAFSMSVVLCAVNLLLIYFLSPQLFALYTDDAGVTSLLYEMLPYILLFHIGDSCQTVIQGAFRGVGRQAVSAKIVFASLWVIGVPLSCIFALSLRWGLRGILVGQIIGFAVEIALLALDMAARWDWDVFAEEAANVVIEVGPASMRSFGGRGTPWMTEMDTA
jgi:MATE family multidrug resistance protein